MEAAGLNSDRAHLQRQISIAKLTDRLSRNGEDFAAPMPVAKASGHIVRSNVPVRFVAKAPGHIAGSIAPRRFGHARAQYCQQCARTYQYVQRLRKHGHTCANAKGVE